MRAEQKETIEKCVRYFESLRKEKPEKVPSFFWNAKMRFLFLAFVFVSHCFRILHRLSASYLHN